MMRLMFARCAIVLLALLASSCATQRVIIDEKPAFESRLFVTKGNDIVTFSWESDPAFAYTVYYNTSRRPGSPWKVVPGLDFIRGTGRTLTYEYRPPPEENRYYRLHAEPAISL
jgi:hypothetical protein